MAISTHVYAAYLIGSPDIELNVKGGTIVLDASSSPHVTGSVTIAIPEMATLTALDPRLSKRIRVDVTATFSDGSQSRSFNLGLRDCDVNHESSEVNLAVASDEAVLLDYSPLTDDNTPRTHEASLRAVINYVLGKVLPGTSLASTPNNNADVTAYWDLQNQLSNPGVEGVLTPWTAGGNCSIFHSTGWTGAPSGTAACGFNSLAAGLLAVTPNAIGNGPAVTAGKTYTMSGYGRRNLTPSRSIYAVIRWLDAAGIPVAPDVEGTPVVMSDSAWTTRCHVTAVAPHRANRAEVFFRVSGSTAAGQIGYIDAAMFHEGTLISYFDGATTDTSIYVYDWTGTANASASSRKTLISAPTPDAFVWKAGQSALDFLLPLVQMAGLRLVCDESRAWTLRDENYSASGALSIRHAINLIDGSDKISRDGGIWFDAQITRYTWLDSAGFQQTAVDAYALSGSPTKTNVIEIASAYPGNGRSEYAVRRAQGRGREVTATAVANWTANAEQPITVILAGAPTQVGQTTSVSFDLSRDEMTVNTRTTDTPVGAIDLLAGNIDSLSGTIDSL